MFQGSIPDSFGGLTSLEFLDLSNNTISGDIPGSLEELIFLKYLNVSFNSLEGEIPKEGPFLNFSAQFFMGNKGLCGVLRLKFSPCKAINKQKTSRAVKKILMYALPITASIIIVAAFILVYIIHWVRKVKLQNDEEISPQMMWKRISYEELSQATNGFSEKNLLGKGSFGSVYKGTLPDGKQIAVKVLHLLLEGALKSFKAECEVLRNIRHRNLVKIISSCSSNDFKALVLEYMPNGSLEKWLYDDNNCFDTIERLNIAIDVASALEYLHHGYDTPIIHCDLKPSNVLLDESMVAHLSDFGISKLLGEEASMTRTQTLATVGYMAPEYGIEGKVSRKGDVFSYGIMLMEIFTRKKPTDEMFSEEMSLKSWVNDSLNGSVMDVIDDNLLRREVKHFDVEEQCFSSILNLALECTRESLEDRIDVKEVVTRLFKARETLLANIEKD